jgi:hypothetical protein
VPACLKGKEEEHDAFNISLRAFGYDSLSSLREPVSLDVTRSLFEHFCVDGFVTQGEPLLIRIQDLSLMV